MTTEELSRAIGYMEYPDPSPRKEPIACAVSHPDAFRGHTGPCGEPAVKEVWAQPFCVRHGDEAKLGALQELTESANNEIEILQNAETPRFDLNPAVRAALGSVSISEGAYHEAYERVASAAYPPEELADNIDPDILRFEYGDYGMSVPPDWYRHDLTLLYRFMRQAYEAGGVLAGYLEPLRERAAVQRLLADRDMERRWAAPMRELEEARTTNS